MKINIEVTSQNYQKHYAFEKEKITIGKKLDADIFLNDKKISRKHAQILFQNHQWWIEDCKSTNGTRVNDKPIQKAPLKWTDKIQISDFTLQMKPSEIRWLESIPEAPKKTEIVFFLGCFAHTGPDKVFTALDIFSRLNRDFFHLPFFISGR